LPVEDLTLFSRWRGDTSSVMIARGLLSLVSPVGHHLGMDGRRIATRVRYGVLVTYICALAIAVWSGVLEIRLAMDSSVPGGVALVLIAAIFIAVTGWRVNVTWKRVNGRL
jgi:hypothetical protein